MSQPYTGQERESFEDQPLPTGFDSQNGRNIQQTSSYWSVPEQTQFPALLRHFGTDWHGIARFMTTKTHIMVYTTVFKQWLIIPSDSNRSRSVANIQTQVKNYYQRYVDSGKINDWAAIAAEADSKRQRGESTGPLPTPVEIPKTRGHLSTPGSVPRGNSLLDGIEDIIPGSQNLMMHQNSPAPPSLSSRFPALAQAGTVAQSLSQPATPTSLPRKDLPSQTLPQHVTQQMQPQRRPPQGPTLGYFNAEPHRHPGHDPRLSRKVQETIQEAHNEKQEALALIRERSPP